MNRSQGSRGTARKLPSSNGTSNHGPTESFAKGAIVKIRLKDFMTYNQVEFNPGPNLNLILGPNGTGKSTIVSAICLGMNGKPSTLGRASTLGAYVRHGAAKATIDIELHNPDGPNFRITREITAVDNKSSWKYQGNPVTKTQIEEVIHSLCIQVDNLCQFLPQEQVQNFSRLNDKQLLISTMNAVGNPELEEKFKNLKRLQVEYGSVSSNQDKDEEEVRKLREENARSEGEVKSFREREKLKCTVKTMEKKKAWMVYQEEAKQYEQRNKAAEELQQEYDRAAARFKPLEKKISQQDNLITRTKEALRNKRGAYTQALTNVNSKISDAEKCKLKMELEVTELNTKRATEKRRLDTLRTTEQQVASIRQELQGFTENEPQVIEELREVEHQLKESDPKLVDIGRRKHVAEEACRYARAELNEQQSKLRNVQDLDNARLTKLRSERPNVHDAVMWLRENKGHFKATIHEPPILSLNIRNTSMAQYVENSISGNDLIAFFCEDKGDMNELLRILNDEKRWKVNAVHSPPSPNGEPTTVEYQPSVAMSELRNYGFSSFLRELFTGPEPVIRYLCKMYRIHNVPVGDGRVYDNFGTIRDQYGSQCPVFFGGNKRIEISRSRYRRDAITQVSEIRPSHMIGQSVDVEAQQHLQVAVSECEERLTEAKRGLEVVVQEETALNRARESLIQKRMNHRKVLGDRRTLEMRLEQKQRQIVSLEREAIDLEEEERKTKRQCGVIMRNMKTMLEEHATQAETMIALDKEKEALQIYVDVLRSSISLMQQKLSNERDKIKQLENERDAAVRQVNEAKRTATQALMEARRLSGVRKYDELPEEVRAEFGKLPDTVAEIEDAVHSANARIQLMGRADEQVVRDYEQREARIQHLINQINRINNRATNIKDEIDQLKNSFLPPLLDLISRINNSFGRFYASMHCAGEVVLYTGEGDTQDDFENYGIKIRVKYRSSEPLIDLSAHHHSGGERAVATALYMLAMQELTQVPFRCVDEINQGMDPINERRVFDLLVQTACQETSAQYFLLTPKLLPGLNYSQNMRIHFVQNGEHVCDEWKVHRHLDIIRNMRKQS